MIALTICSVVMIFVGFFIYAERNLRIGGVIMWSGLVILLLVLLVYAFVRGGA